MSIEPLDSTTPEEIEEFLHGNDPEKYIVALEYGWRSGRIYKIKEYPDRGKVVESDTFIPFCWVGDLSKKNFYNGAWGGFYTVASSNMVDMPGQGKVKI